MIVKITEDAQWFSQHRCTTTMSISIRETKLSKASNTLSKFTLVLTFLPSPVCHPNEVPMMLHLSIFHTLLARFWSIYSPHHIPCQFRIFSHLNVNILWPFWSCLEFPITQNTGKVTFVGNPGPSVSELSFFLLSSSLTKQIAIWAHAYP